MTITHLLNRDLERWRRTDTPDGSGGYESSWVQVDTVAARLSSPSPAERQTAAQEGVDVSHVAYLHPDSDVARGERLVDGDLNVEVVSVVTPSVAHHRRAVCRQEPWTGPTD